MNTNINPPKRGSVILRGGQRVWNVHPRGQCAGEFCTIHNPSNHHMRSWRQNWRSDRLLMERVCSHGVGHPDPDEVGLDVDGRFIHGCDGCCVPPEEREQVIAALAQALDLDI